MDEKKIDQQVEETSKKAEEAAVKLEKDDVDEVAGGSAKPIVTPEI